jgi:hypothetical protein
VLFKLTPEHKGSSLDDVVAAADAEDEAFFNDFRSVSFAEPLSVQPPEEVEPGFVLGRADLTPTATSTSASSPTRTPSPTTSSTSGMLGFINVK